MDKLRIIMIVVMTNLLMLILAPIAAILDTIRNIVKGVPMKGYVARWADDLRDLHEQQLCAIIYS